MFAIKGVILNLKLEKSKWYAWKIIPGYKGELYHSPVKIQKVESFQGGECLKLYFHNSCYTGREKDCIQILKIIFHSKESMICELRSEDKNLKLNKMVIIEKIDFYWLKRYIDRDCKETNSSIEEFLEKHY